MLHGFMQDRHWYEDLGHILLGLLPIDLLLWVREFTDWKLPWLFKGQWPPGRPMKFGFELGANKARIFDSLSSDTPENWLSSRFKSHVTEYTQMDRVSDLARDQLGYAIGQQLRVCLLVGLLWWRW